MNSYVMSIHKYPGIREKFVIEAENKREAISKGLVFVAQNPKYISSQYDINDVRCEKKLRKKPG